MLAENHVRLHFFSEHFTPIFAALPDCINFQLKCDVGVCADFFWLIAIR